MNTTVAITICSNALMLIGDEPIASFSDDRVGAKIASSFYETTLISLLSEYTWSFATKQDKLSMLSEKPLNRWDYVYQLPTDHIRTITVYPVGDYDIVGDKIYSNTNNLELDYMYRIDESFFTPLFREALELHLASKFSIPVTENATNADLYFGMAQKMFKKAKLIDSQEKPNRGIPAAAAIPLRLRNRGGHAGRRGY